MAQLQLSGITRSIIVCRTVSCHRTTSFSDDYLDMLDRQAVESSKEITKYEAAGTLETGEQLVEFDLLQYWQVLMFASSSVILTLSSPVPCRS